MLGVDWGSTVPGSTRPCFQHRSPFHLPQHHLVIQKEFKISLPHPCSGRIMSPPQLHPGRARRSAQSLAHPKCQLKVPHSLPRHRPHHHDTVTHTFL